ncbi:MAG: 1-acyl-sn-glycerol-3-phosphate acyltransferase [Pseudomonadota bacterium]|jgi:1-acyl-sn-glycerol-3-phosphate acyltransferase
MPIRQRIARFILRRLGWTCLDIESRPQRAVLVAYPHTSNWDFPLGLLVRAALGLNIRWAGKDTLFRGLLGPLMRGLGGIPVNRREPAGQVERMAAELSAGPPFLLAIAPEGTRSLTPGWKSGFHRIARAAGVPIVAGTIDYGRRRIGLLATLEPGEDIDADLAALAEFYRDCRGLRPELAAPVRRR